MNNRDLRRFQRVMGDPGFQQFCVGWANEAGVPLPRGGNPALYVMSELFKADPNTCVDVFNRCLGEFEKHHGAPPVGPHDAHDWDAELPAGEVLKAWKALPEHSRLRQSATAPHFEQMAQRDLAKMGGHRLPGLSAGETVAAYVNFAPRSKALARGDRAAYDSLAARLGGALGDGEGLRWMVGQVQQIHRDDHVLHRIQEKSAAAEAEVAKHRARPVDNPVYDKKHLPQNAPIQAKKKVDGTREEVARQYAREKAGWAMDGRQPPRQKVVHDRLTWDIERAIRKSRGESLEGLTFSDHFRKEMVKDQREKGWEPAFATSSGNASSRQWVPASTSSVSGGSYASDSTSSSGGYSGGTSSSESSGGEAPAQTGSGT